MAIALWILVAIVCALGLVLIIPVDLGVRATAGQGAALQVSLAPVAGKLPPISIVDTARGKGRPKPTPKARQRVSGRSGRGRALLNAVPRLVVELVAAFHLRSVTANVIFGLGDPADTGRLYGALAPLAFGLSAWPANRIQLQPDFENAVVGGQIDLRLRVRPGALILPIMRFAWHVFVVGR